ncbi:uncharacterized protein HD556DRAFT_1450355 [Suillus plorans]|uniref:Uncharacterized protein n=1 Tax=Suillus plorans TaxID=116603 RepID=A0A9P7ACS4_9AGAM|nr:uncharacterized protein HD556DRAFT_1450355 [Suillus plorans]KAG1785802.1 hypothetical protein HD556DRAFT_1450355 [Suillus plorans]
MNFNLAPFFSNDLQDEGPCAYPSTPLQRPYYLSNAGTPSTPSHHSDSPPRSPSLVSTTGSAANASDADDDVLPLTPDSKSSFRIAHNGAWLHKLEYSPKSTHHIFFYGSSSSGAGPQTQSCPPESEHNSLPNHRPTVFEDQSLFDRLSGRYVDPKDTSEALSERAKKSYMRILQDLNVTTFQCAIQYLEAVHERHRMLYHAACWEVSEHARREALARSMCETLKHNFVTAEQEVRLLLEIFSQRLALSHHPVASCSVEASEISRASVRRTDAVLSIVNGAKELRSGDSWYVLL